MTGLLVDARAVPSSERYPSLAQSKRRALGHELASSSGRSPAAGTQSARMVSPGPSPTRSDALNLGFSPHTQLEDTFHIASQAPAGALYHGVESPRTLTVSPKDRNKLSINFLSDDRPRADALGHSRSHSSVLSTRARGVNRQDLSVNRSEDVEVDTDAPGSPIRYI